ncbi:Uncharacterised protein [Helicobacter canis]|uniref:Autotransporter domain-containing protein n=1 Tax=Helicobacter canis TaxID=29419 RepID=A0A377J6K3_9HELI|nr:Uncharacterised protein [Helicobacter canis]
MVIHKSTQVDSSNDYSASAECMDCHATAAAVSHNDRKPTRLSLSLACFFALSSMAAASTPTIPENDPNNFTIMDNRNAYQVVRKQHGQEGILRSTLKAWGGSSGQWRDTSGISHYDYYTFAFKYRDGGLPGGVNLLFNDGTKFDYYSVHYKREGGGGSSPWVNMNTRDKYYSNHGNSNITIGTFDLKGDVKFEIKLGGTSNITTLNNEAERLNIKVNNENNDKLNITTFNQTTANGDSQIFKNVSIENFNLYAGKSYQRGGNITNLNITGGSFYQGYTDNLTAGEHDGTIETITLQDGIFQQGKGSVTTLNQSGGGAIQQGGTITNLNLSGGTFTHNGGTLSNVVLKAGGSGSTFVNGTDSAFDNITQEGGNHTIIGKVAKFTLASGSFTNNGSITTLTTNTTTKQARSGTNFYAAQAAATNHITNNGTIDKLELTKDADSVTNNAVYNTGGGLASGIIKELSVTKGSATINTLNGVGQGTAGNVEPHTLSNINITKDAKLTVDTLSVGLKGNQAIERVTINNDTSTQGTNKEFAVNKIQVTYLDGNFDPAKSISKNLTDYVTSGSHSYVDGASKPTFESSPELQGIGVKFNPDGTPIFDVEASVAASMTSVVVRQSMRRKMLIDTYLAEQNRRSLKNKERRTKQRIEAATLGDARAQYQKDLAKYKLDLAKWDKLASTKENKALIAKYEQEDKAYQAAKAQYDKDKKAYEDNRKNLELLSKAQKIKAPIEPKAPVMPNLKPSDKHYKKAMANYDKAQKAYEKAMSNYEQELRIYTEENNKLETIARASNLKAPIAPKAPIRPNLKPNHKDYKRVMAAYESNQRAYQAALKQYELDKKSYEEKRKRLEVLAKTSKFNANLKAPTEPKAPMRPNLKPNHKDYKKAMSKYEQERKDYLKAFKQYEQDKKSYEREYQKLIALADAQSNKLKAPIQPKAPTKPKILASKPEMPQEPKLGEISAELLAKHKVQGDFFIRAYGGTGSHKATNGAQTSSWSVGTLFGSTWDLALGQTSGNIGFYGGYEYIYNGYKQAHIDAQGHTGFLGLRFSHIFAKTKLAGFYYMADVNGGYTDISVGQDMNGMRFGANVGNINFGSSIRLGSSIYMAGAKSMLFPSIGVGVEGGYLGDFEMRTQRSGELRYGGLSQGYAVTYAQANLNYYQEYGKRLSTTLGGGFRYLMNTDINIMPTLNGKAYTIDEKTGRAAAVHVAPFFYQGTFMVNYHTDKAGNFSAGYVVVGGELGITHNASVRWHYFF